jgi:phage shock protein A
MPIITRLGRLFRADLHAVLDHIEEPAALLRQAVREMEDALEQDGRRLQLLRHELAELDERRAELERSAVELDEELDICLAARQEELAKGLIRRRLEHQGLGKRIDKRRQQTRAALEKLAAQVDHNARQLDAMRQKVELLAREPAVGEPPRPWTPDAVNVRDEDVEVAFLREMQRRAQA